MTFRAYDIDKFLAYAPHADIVNGTRIVEQLRAFRTQLTTAMYYGNFLVGKLLEVKHLGRGTFTDVGTTYKLCRNSELVRLLPLLDPRVNLEFNAHFLDTALGHGFSIVECPVTFHARYGPSKGSLEQLGRPEGWACAWSSGSSSAGRAWRERADGLSRDPLAVRPAPRRALEDPLRVVLPAPGPAGRVRARRSAPATATSSITSAARGESPSTGGRA